MSEQQAQQGATPGTGADAAREPTEEELRAAYEEELARLTSADLMLQAAVSLLNLGGRRLGLGGSAQAGGEGEGGQRDLEQVRDAIDGVRALLGVLERRFAKELGPLRDALSQLQIAYARETQSGASASAPGPASEPGAPGGEEQGGPAGEGDSKAQQQPRRPGPAESSGRLWVPDR